VSNVTFRLDEETLRRDRSRALERGTSLDAIVEELLATWCATDPMAARRRLVTLAERHAAPTALDDECEGTRDDLYAGRTRWPRS